MRAQVRNRVVLVVSLLVACGALSMLAFGNLGESLVYYWNPSEVRAAGPQAIGAAIRLGGFVKPGSLVWNEASHELRFVVSDGDQELEVRDDEPPPDMLREGIGALIEGTMTAEGYFAADRLMVKHSNEYRAPVEGQHLQDAYKTVEGL